MLQIVAMRTDSLLLIFTIFSSVVWPCRLALRITRISTTGVRGWETGRLGFGSGAGPNLVFVCNARLGLRIALKISWHRVTFLGKNSINLHYF